MNKIKFINYNLNMGQLIDVSDSLIYSDDHYPGSVNIPLNKLLINHKDLLSKNNTYYVTCRNGVKSRKAVSILEFYGYKVIQVL